MGEVFAGNKLGKKAMFWGAFAQSIPDIDFLASFWLDTSNYLSAHRGLTHSFLFVFIVAFLLSLYVNKRFVKSNIVLIDWFIFFTINIFIHIFIDSFNSYGVGWFEPFSNVRISFNTLFVIDPLFSIWSFIAFIYLLFSNDNKKFRIIYSRAGLISSFLYIILSFYNKSKIDSSIHKQLCKNNISHIKYFSAPAPFQIFLWYIVVGTKNGYFISYKSIFDNKPEKLNTYFPINDSLQHEIINKDELGHLINFSQNYYTIEKWNDTLVFNDLRFGQILGWNNNKNHFVFHYYLNCPTANTFVVQRGRFEGWNFNNIQSMIKRIEGN